MSLNDPAARRAIKRRDAIFAYAFPNPVPVRRTTMSYECKEKLKFVHQDSKYKQSKEKKRKKSVYSLSSSGSSTERASSKKSKEKADSCSEDSRDSSSSWPSSFYYPDHLNLKSESDDELSGLRSLLSSSSSSSCSSSDSPSTTELN